MARRTKAEKQEEIDAFDRGFTLLRGLLKVLPDDAEAMAFTTEDAVKFALDLLEQITPDGSVFLVVAAVPSQDEPGTTNVSCTTNAETESLVNLVAFATDIAKSGKLDQPRAPLA